MNNELPRADAARPARIWADSAQVRSDQPIAQTPFPRAFLNSLHPSGDAASILPVNEPVARERGDVVLLTMTSEQCSDKRERERLTEQAVSSLAANGIIWVDVPGRWRSALMSALRLFGMATGAVTVHRARGAAGAEIALTSGALRFALSRGHLSWRWRLAVALLEWLPFGQALITRVLPAVGFAAFHPGTRPFAWLVDRIVAEPHVDIALITNWRGERAPHLVFAVGAGQALVAKRGGAECEDQIAHETSMLKLLNAGLAHCGLDAPRLMDGQRTAKLLTLIETDVPGRSMAGLIREGHHRDFGKIADVLAHWLACWNSQTLRHVELTPDLGERLILSPARSLAGSIDRGSAYLKWLSRQCGRLVGTKIPVVAAHNDLTMANVLGDWSRIRSVVDWEAASLDGLPLTDLHYACCDAAAAIEGGDRVAAFRACFLEDSGFRRRLRQSEAPLRAIAGGPPEWLELCSHAGWLRHAANEKMRSSTSPIDRSFVAITNLLAKSVLAD